MVLLMISKGMKHYLIGFGLLIVVHVGTISAENTSKGIESIRTEINALKAKQRRMNADVQVLVRRSRKAERQISDLQSLNIGFASKVDSLQAEQEKLVCNQKADKSELKDSISVTNQKILTTENSVSSRTLWGIGALSVLLILIIGAVIAFVRKFRADTSSIDNVRKAQEALQVAQVKMQEESVRLDDKLLELLDKQMAIVPHVMTDDKPDHSLALKVADEIVRIELNMSRMDSAVKGYKQLAKAVERIKDNFKANGYEIVDMLGKPYNEGMKVVANFVPDETLSEGAQIITGITKPQINYNGQMIQAAQITVSQNI